MTSIQYTKLHLHLHLLKGNIDFAIMVWHLYCFGIVLACEILLQYRLQSIFLKVLDLGWQRNIHKYADLRILCNLIFLAMRREIV